MHLDVYLLLLLALHTILLEKEKKFFSSRITSRFEVTREKMQENGGKVYLQILHNGWTFGEYHYTPLEFQRGICRNVDSGSYINNI